MMSPHVIIVLTVAVTSYSGAQYFLEGNLVIYLPAGPFVWITAGKNKRLITLGDSALPPDHPASLHRSLGVSIQAASLAWMLDERWLVRWGGVLLLKQLEKTIQMSFLSLLFCPRCPSSRLSSPPPPSVSVALNLNPSRQYALAITARRIKM